MAWQDIVSDPIFWVIVVVLIILIIITMYLIIRAISKKREDHVGQYFEGNFRTIIGEWDLVTRPTLKSWKTDTQKRLGSIDKDVSSIERARTDIDSRLKSLDREIVKMEKY